MNLFFLAFLASEKFKSTSIHHHDNFNENPQKYFNNFLIQFIGVLYDDKTPSNRIDCIYISLIFEAGNESLIIVEKSI